MVVMLEGGLVRSGPLRAGHLVPARRRKYYPMQYVRTIDPGPAHGESTDIGIPSRTAQSIDPGATGGTWTMADRRRSEAHATGARSRDAVSSPVAGAASAGGSGSSTSTAPKRARRPVQGPANHLPATRATYRLLLLKGLAADEAANLTAYLCGLPVSESRWTLSEVNRLLFLRELLRSGRWGLDGEERRLH